MFTGEKMSQVQVQLRVPKEMVKQIDSMVRQGRFASRSDAIKAMISSYEERERTRAFVQMLLKRSEEAVQNPDILIPL